MHEIANKMHTIR